MSTTIPEGELIWLEADTIIRKQSGGKKSLNDFCARFHGLGGDTPPKVVPYTFDDVVENLNAVVPYDWATFLHERITTQAGSCTAERHHEWRLAAGLRREGDALCDGG